MKASFWHKCWERDHIGFHQQSPHPLLTQLWQQWTQGDCSTVFVPLCGKSGDMVYIANTNKVIGAELSDIACRDFYVENGLEYTTGQQP
ncbi:MAG: thiopurine S-methyltransferase, partial [Alteromonadaceae bacterium]